MTPEGDTGRVRRVPSLTALRGIAALMVVEHHFTKILLPDLGAAIRPHTGILAGAYLWVDLFFLLSGFVLAHVYAESFRDGTPLREYGNFVVARLARIYPVHIVVLVAFLVVELTARWMNLGEGLSVGPVSGDRSWGAFIVYASLTQILTFSQATAWNEPSWSIGAEWIGYLLLPWVMRPLLRLSTGMGIAVAGASLSALVALEAHFGHLDLAGYPGLTRCVAEMWCGVLLYRVYASGWARRILQADLTFIATSVAVLGILHASRVHVVFVPAAMLLLLSGSSNRAGVARALESRPLVWLGDLSYSVYMVHWLVQTALMDGWAYVLHTRFGVGLTLLEQLYVVLGSTVVVVGLAKGVYERVERPARSFLRSRWSASTR